MYQRIVVGTDGGATASIAVSRAAELAAQCGAELTIVSSYKPIPTRKVAAQRSTMPEEYAWTLHSEQEVMRTLGEAKRLASGLGVEAKTEARTEDPVEAILLVAGEAKADVVVVGSKGMERRVLGSVPNSVAHNAPCDVLIVQTT
jgi:nucleotide-binding universal stress UspA family protein